MPRLTTAAAAATVALAAAGVAFLALRAEAAPPEDAETPLVIYGADGMTPAYVEDPLDEFGIPIPVGPQHEASSITVPATSGPNTPGPFPVVESETFDDGFGNKIPASSFGSHVGD